MLLLFLSALAVVNGKFFSAKLEIVEIYRLANKCYMRYHNTSIDLRKEGPTESIIYALDVNEYHNYITLYSSRRAAMSKIQQQQWCTRGT